MQTSSISFAPHVEIGDSARRIANARARDSCPPQKCLPATDISIYAYLRGKKSHFSATFCKEEPSRSCGILVYRRWYGIVGWAVS